MASRFKAVVKTEGDDIDHLMVALDHLTSWFNIQIIFIGVAVGVAVLGIIAAFTRGCKLNSVQNRKFDYGSELFRQFRRKSARTV